jgi:uncharacterized iron-regulated protein
MIKFVSLFLSLSFSLLAIEKPAYLLYNAKGKKVSYEKMLKDLRGQEVVLIGELHNNPISHWLELEITQALAEQRQLVLGAEMFERDNQLALTIYLQGKITAKGLDSSAHFLFSNWKPGSLFIHYNGSYHSEYHEGISWYLKRSNADYIICVEEDMTGTY